MLVPTAMEELHETHAALDEPARDEAARAELRRRRIIDHAVGQRFRALGAPTRGPVRQQLAAAGQRVEVRLRLRVDRHDYERARRSAARACS